MPYNKKGVADQRDNRVQGLVPPGSQPLTAASRSSRRGLLAGQGTQLGRPYADRIQGSKYRNLKELRPRGPSARNIRILFMFDPQRQAVLLLGGDKTGKWSAWYRRAIPEAERLYEQYLNDLDTAPQNELGWMKEIDP